MPAAVAQPLLGKQPARLALEALVPPSRVTGCSALGLCPRLGLTGGGSPFRQILLNSLKFCVASV